MELTSQILILFPSLVSTARIRITIHSFNLLTYINVLFLTHTFHSILLHILFFSLEIITKIYTSASTLGRITNVYFSAIPESVLNKCGV